MTVSAVSVREAKARFSEISNRVVWGGERFIIKRHDKPFVALVSVDDLKRIEELEGRLSLQREHPPEQGQALRELRAAYLTMSEQERQVEIAHAEEGLRGQISPDEAFPDEEEWPWWE
jgi:prevent-host-death family protein